MIVAAMKSLGFTPDIDFVLQDDGNGVYIRSWASVQTKPTEAEINAEIIRLEADYAAKQYQRDRAKAYPSIVDQLDTLYHSGIDAWKQEIKAVKDQYPKGAM
jgi:hypothetical protein